ncbi:glycosyltransferase family 2 protein [Pikeienuella sp. HZG-20]|uniref:glycosyltransferase family 2 protein n=1 Tax=Paludibacillus litoralis TaxID=3133267 RepID=UPI0030EF7E38
MSEKTPPGAHPSSVSVVIPFYRDEAYLEDALRSARRQPIDDLEIIVVNDNPGEESDAFLADVSARHSIRVARHAVNRGLSAARNTGMDLATKAFIAFLDADDVFIEGGLAANLSRAAAAGSDITHAPTMILQVDQTHPRLLRRDALLFSRDVVNTTLKRAPEAQYIVSSWCSLYRREFLRDRAVRFDEAQRMYEDRLFVLEAVTKAETISFTSAPARIWRRRMGSITTSAKRLESVALQCELVVKCMALAKAHVAAGGDAMFLLREAAHSIDRLIWDVNLYARDPAETPELDGARARLQAAFQDVRFSRRIFADRISIPFSRVGKALRGRRPVTRAMFAETFAATQAGRWADLHRWRKSLDIAPDYWAAPKPAPLAAELVLHVGLHKTGTTHIQRALERDRERLRGEGVLFPETGFLARVRDNPRGDATPGHVGLYAALRRGDLSPFAALRAECAASGCGRVIVSSENLSFPLGENNERAGFFAAAREAATLFSKVSVLAVIRRPDAYIDRYYRELVFLAKHWARRSPEQFAFETAPSLTDLEALLGGWTEIARGDLRLIPYDAARESGLAAAFYRELGLTPPAGADVDGGATYASPGAAQTIVARAIACSTLPRGQKMRALGVFLRESSELGAESGGSLLSFATRRALIRKFETASSGFLAAHGCAPMAERWRADLDREEAGAARDATIDPRLVDCAVSAMEMAAAAKAAPETPSTALRVYRRVKGGIARFR